MGELAKRRRARDLWISRGHLWAAGVGVVLVAAISFFAGVTVGRSADDESDAASLTRRAGVGSSRLPERRSNRASAFSFPVAKKRIRSARKRAGTVRVIRMEPPGAWATRTARLFSSRTGDPGKSEAVCPSSPTPSKARSKRG